MPLAQGAQAVQTAALVVILEELHETWRGGAGASGLGQSPKPEPALPRGRVLSRAGTSETLTLVHGEGQKLVPELLVHEAVGPESREQRAGWGLRDAPLLPAPRSPEALGPSRPTHHVSMTPDRNVDT